MKYLLPFITLLLCASLVTPGQVPSGPGWRIAAESSDMWVYYNKARVTRSAGKSRVWVQYVDSKSQKLRTQDFYEYNCAAEMVRTLSQIKYSPDGTVLRSVTPKFPAWDYISPDSLGEAIFQIVCKGAKDLEQRMGEDAYDSFQKGQAYEADGYLEAALIQYEYALHLFPEESRYKNAVERVRAAIARSKQQ